MHPGGCGQPSCGDPCLTLAGRANSLGVRAYLQGGQFYHPSPKSKAGGTDMPCTATNAHVPSGRLWRSGHPNFGLAIVNLWYRLGANHAKAELLEFDNKGVATRPFRIHDGISTDP